MENETIIRQTLASNLTHYRKLNNLTQAQVAEKINYSDKAISKWERGEGVPDIYTLCVLADIYHISINDLLSEKKIKKLPSQKRNKIIITLLSTLLTWLVATIVFVFVVWLGKDKPWFNDWCYIPYIYAIPISFIILIVFNKIWGRRRYSFFLVSCLVWTVALSFERSFAPYIDNAWMFYIVCIPLEVLTCLWYLIIKKPSNYNR